MAAALPECAAAMRQKIAEWVKPPGRDAVSGIVAISTNADRRDDNAAAGQHAQPGLVVREHVAEHAGDEASFSSRVIFPGTLTCRVMLEHTDETSRRGTRRQVSNARKMLSTSRSAAGGNTAHRKAFGAPRRTPAKGIQRLAGTRGPRPAPAPGRRPAPASSYRHPRP